MGSDSNQAELNKRATMGREAKKKAKKSGGAPKQTWSKKLWEKNQVVEQNNQKHDEQLAEHKYYKIDTAHAVKVQTADGKQLFVVVNDETQIHLMAAQYNTDGVFRSIDPKATYVFTSNEFKFDWTGVKRPSKQAVTP